MKKQSVVLRRVAGVVFSGALLTVAASCHAQTAPMGQAFTTSLSGQNPTAPVDEPIGARSSLGLTLWHLGHQADAITRFHQFLKAQNLTPQSLLPASEQAVPASFQRILIEPETTASALLNGWKTQGDYIVSTAADNGPSASLPLHIDRAGLYRLWTAYYNSPSAVALTSLKIYRLGREGDGPLLNDEIYDAPRPQEGVVWKDVMVDLSPGDYIIKLGHARSWWHVTGGQMERGSNALAQRQLRQRMIDCVYLTDELWAGPPAAATRAALRAQAPNGGQWMANVPVGNPEVWRWWQVRPLSWEERDNGRLFDLSRGFWRSEVDALAAQDYGNTPPDYRLPVRQVIFDDTWNMMGNPVIIKRRIAELSRGVNTGVVGPAASRATPAGASYVIKGSDFQQLGADWEKDGTSLRAGYGVVNSNAATDVRVTQAGRYTAWVRFKILPGFFAPWRISVQPGRGGGVAFDHLLDNYDSEWQRVGQINAIANDNVRITIAPLPARKPNTYRVIHEVLLTTQNDFVPSGDARPEMGQGDLAARIQQSGAQPGDKILAWFASDPYRAPISQDPFAAESWPAQAAPARVALPSGAQTSVLVGLRNLTGAPLTLSVNAALLSNAGTVPNGANWRVVAFAPYETPRDAKNPNAPPLSWSPFALLRRPGITVPPMGVAGLWLTLDSSGAAPGNYSLRVSLGGSATRALNLPVRISPVRAAPQRPVIIGGYTDPPEGESYWQDARAHGIGIGYSPMSRDDMARRGLRLLSLNVRNQEDIAPLLSEVRRLGLNNSDWAFAVKDEPGSPDKVPPFIELARQIKAADPGSGLSFNPGEGATLATFQMLDPYTSIWMPFARHLVNPPAEAPAKRAIFTAKPWLWYTTPAYRDKESQTPQNLFEQIRSVPTQPGNCLGTAFFALNYPFRDAWDTAYEFLPDVSSFVLASRYGPVATPGWEAVRDASIDANLAQMVKERGGRAPAQLIASGDTDALLQWLEANGG